MYLSLSPHVHRAMLGVPGAPYSLLLPRSSDFTPFLILLYVRYADPVDRTSPGLRTAQHNGTGSGHRLLPPIPGGANVGVAR